MDHVEVRLQLEDRVFVLIHHAYSIRELKGQGNLFDFLHSGDVRIGLEEEVEKFATLHSDLIRLASFKLTIELINVEDLKNQRVIHLKDALVRRDHVVGGLATDVHIETLDSDCLSRLRSERIQTQAVRQTKEDANEQDHTDNRHCKDRQEVSVELDEVVNAFDHANTIQELKGQGN
jgi:hypothetical protein